MVEILNSISNISKVLENLDSRARKYENSPTLNFPDSY